MRCEICNWCSTTGEGLDPIHASYQGNRVRYYPKTGRTICGACLSIEKEIRIDYENDLRARTVDMEQEDTELIDTEDVQEDSLAMPEV